MAKLCETAALSSESSAAAIATIVRSDGQGCQIALGGPTHDAVLLSNTTSFSTTMGRGGSTNVYWSEEAEEFVLQACAAGGLRQSHSIWLMKASA